MKAMSWSYLAMAAGLALAACSPNGAHNSSSDRVAAGVIAASSLPPDQKAEELALAAEKLLDAQGFLQARDIVDEALRQDATNLRAQFIRTALAPILLEKGILVRIRPLAQQNPLALASLDREVAKVKAGPDNAFARFLLDGQPDIKTEADAQSLVDQYLRAVDAVRAFARAHRDTELTIKAGSVLVPNLAKRYAQACQITQTAKLDYQLTCPKPITRTEVTLNGADFELLQGIAAYVEWYTIIGTSYDLTGATAVAATKAGQEDVHAADLVPGLIQNAAFGRLRRQQLLPRIKPLGLDIVNGARWVMNHQSEMCPTGETGPRNRPGFFINEGLCIPTYFAPYLQQLEDIISNVPQTVTNDKNGRTIMAKASYMTPLLSPMADLRQLGRPVFDRCKFLVHVDDVTLGGVFPNGDANAVLASGAGECNR